MKYNKHFDLLGKNYLFKEISRRVNEFKSRNPEVKLINLGIGDVTQPLAQTIVDAGLKATAEMGFKQTFKGYGDYEGYEFLREAIRQKYKRLGVNLELNEIFVGDGAKSDMAHILTLFKKCTALIPNPVYPVYLDTNIMASNAVLFAEGNIANGFLPCPDGRECDLIYICSPSNPTGAVYSKEQLKEWVDYALLTGAVILFDSAYESYISGDYPHSIFEIEGADQCAVEFNSLSKSAGFTGVRCGWTIIPDGLKINKMYHRYIAASYNGAPYIIQRMAEAALSKEGQEEIKKQLSVYKRSCLKICKALEKKGIWHTGGINSPYIWLKCGGNSWDFFDYMLNERHIVGTPGSGFGSAGEGYFRLSAFGLDENDKIDLI